MSQVRYFIQDKEAYKERKNPYYHLRENEEICRKILLEFDRAEEYAQNPLEIIRELRL